MLNPENDNSIEVLASTWKLPCVCVFQSLTSCRDRILAELGRLQSRLFCMMKNIHQTCSDRVSWRTFRWGTFEVYMLSQMDVIRAHTSIRRRDVRSEGGAQSGTRQIAVVKVSNEGDGPGTRRALATCRCRGCQYLQCQKASQASIPVVYA